MFNYNTLRKRLYLILTTFILVLTLVTPTIALAASGIPKP